MPRDFAPNEWHELEALIDRVLDVAPGGRVALIAELSGGDPERRAELARLVAECEREHPLLDRPVAERFPALFEREPITIPEVLAERYRIVRELGSGGMAVVYLARDMKHEREVAVKVVRPEVAAALGRARFLREIAIAAQLRHPHIVPLFDSGEVGGVLYYVMPYQEEQSLRERLRRDGPLPINDAIDILCDVCDALAYAHQQGVVHRDIKPDNVLLSGRHAIVTDFGVARAVTAASEQEPLTTAGGVVGTAAYMAPEQSSADSSTDHRADIYAVGVMAYEMLVGERPFTGVTPRSQRPAHSASALVDLTRLGRDVPPALSHVIMKCLAQNALERWQTADELLTALATEHGVPSARHRRGSSLAKRRRRQRWTAATAGAIMVSAVAALVTTDRVRKNSLRVSAKQSSVAIGILPVRSASPGGDLDWLSRGLESQLSMELTEVVGLEVRPTETIAAHITSGWSLDSIALAREVDYFVRATLSKGERDYVVATLELIEGGIKSVRAGTLQEQLQTENAVAVLGRRVAEQLRPMLGTRVRERQLEASTTNQIALQLRRQADHHRLIARDRLDKGDLPVAEQALDSARALFLASQRQAPQWTAPQLARAALSELGALLVLVKSGALAYSNIRLVYNQGIAILDSILTKTPNDAVALASRGRLRWQRVLFGEQEPHAARTAIDSAERDLRTAIRLDTALARAAADLSQLLFEQSRYDDAVEYAERAYRLDAYMERAGEIIKLLAQSNFEMGRDSEAAQWCREGRRREPGNPAHVVCFLDVMAWGTERSNPDSAWMFYRDLERVMRGGNVTLIAYAGAAVAAVLAKSSHVPSDSARSVLARTRAMVDASSAATQELRDDLFAFEAAVLYRLRDTARANERFAQFRQRNVRKAELLAQRRMLRGFVSAGPS